MEFDSCDLIVTKSEGDGYMQTNQEDAGDYDAENMSTRDFPIICRICLERGDLLPIFGFQVEESSSNVTLTIHHLLQECVDIQVKPSDHLPQNICVTCLRRLTKIYHYKKQCFLNEATLKLILLESVEEPEENFDKPNVSVKQEVEDYVAEENSETVTQEDSEYMMSHKQEYIVNDNNEEYMVQENEEEAMEQSGEIIVQANTSGNVNYFNFDEVDTYEEVYDEVDNEPLGEAQEQDQDDDQDNPDAQTVYAEGIEENPEQELVEADHQNYQYQMGQKMMVIENQTAVEGIKNELTQDMEEESVTEAGLFHCEQCPLLAFASREDLRNHKKEAQHFKLRNHLCNICHTLWTKEELERHLRKHTRERPFQCETCGRGFSMKVNLDRHIKTHTGEKPFICEKCGKGFIQSSSLMNHRERYPNCNVKNEKEGANHFECNVCKRILKNHYQFTRHLKQCDPDRLDLLVMLEKEDPKPFICEICGHSFESIRRLSTHKSIHMEKNHICSVCEMKFRTKATLNAHFRTHTKERPYVCDVCQKSFIQACVLEAHKRIHTGEKPFPCPYCEKKFTQAAHLLYHKRTHTGERPYACSYCNSRFALKGNLTVHERTHTGETPYLCQVCGKGFYDSSSRNKHQRGHGNMDIQKLSSKHTVEMKKGGYETEEDTEDDEDSEESDESLMH